MKKYDLEYWAAFRAASECERALAKKGISLHVTVDKAEVFGAVERIGKPYLTPWLDPSRNDFTPNNYFWLIASREGEPVIVGGGRLDVVGRSADRYMFEAFTRGYGDDAILGVNPEVSARLRGRLCYLGDLYSKSGVGLSQVHRRHYVGVANFIASQHFKADYTYSFMRILDVRRGSADLNGLDRRIYQPLRWGCVPQGRDRSEVIVYREASDDSAYFGVLMQELAQCEPESTGALAGLPQEGQS